jgi:hypothetical protein
MGKDLGFCEKDRRMHQLEDFMLMEKSRWNSTKIYKCKFCGTPLKVYNG